MLPVSAQMHKTTIFFQVNTMGRGRPKKRNYHQLAPKYQRSLLAKYKKSRELEAQFGPCRAIRLSAFNNSYDHSEGSTHRDDVMHTKSCSEESTLSSTEPSIPQFLRISTVAPAASGAATDQLPTSWESAMESIAGNLAEPEATFENLIDQLPGTQATASNQSVPAGLNESLINQPLTSKEVAAGNQPEPEAYFESLMNQPSTSRKSTHSLSNSPPQASNILIEDEIIDEEVDDNSGDENDDFFHIIRRATRRQWDYKEFDPSTKFQRTKGVVKEIRLICLRLKHSDVNKILRALSKIEDFYYLLPKDARTFLGTSAEKTDFKPCPPNGKYVHFGLLKGLLLFLEEYIANIDISETLSEIEIIIAVDGLSPDSNSHIHLWPIMCAVLAKKWKNKMHVFTVGMYEGKSAPSDNRIFFQETLNELIEILKNGVSFAGRIIKVKLLAFVGDAPGRAFMLGVKSHSGYHSCHRCKISGSPGVVFLDKNCEPRTHAEAADHFNRTRDMMKKSVDRHFTDYTVLKDVPGFDLVLDTPIDYQHCVLLGIVRGMIKTWLTPKEQGSLKPDVINAIEVALKSAALRTPKEFQRKPLELRSDWKATESRIFLLYIGPVILKPLLPEAMYRNFMKLSGAIRIAVDPVLCRDNVHLIKEQLEEFVTGYMKIYGTHKMSYNLHAVLHLHEDVLRLGPLDLGSTFHFESHLYNIKHNYLRTYTKPSAQYSKRLSEERANLVLEIDEVAKNSFCLKMPLKEKYQYDIGVEVEQFRCCKFAGWEMRTEMPNNVFGLKNGDIIVVSNIFVTLVRGKSKLFVAGRRYLDVRECHYYSEKEEVLVNQMKFVSCLGPKEEISINEIQGKYILLKIGRTNIAIRLLHTH